MTKSVLKFSNLSALAQFYRLINHKPYLINIQRLTLQCGLTKQELEKATEEFEAAVVTSVLSFA